MGKIDEEKAKVAKEKASLQSDLKLAEDRTNGLFAAVVESEISSGVDPSDGPGPPILLERSETAEVEAYCPVCKGQSWKDNPNVRMKELLRTLHSTKIRDDADPQDTINALPFENSEKYGCRHGHFKIYAKVKEEAQNRLTQEVWNLIRYRAKIRKAIKALEPAPPQKDDTIWETIQ